MDWIDGIGYILSDTKQRMKSGTNLDIRYKLILSTPKSEIEAILVMYLPTSSTVFRSILTWNGSLV